jgi:hypothetical protein
VRLFLTFANRVSRYDHVAENLWVLRALFFSRVVSLIHSERANLSAHGEPVNPELANLLAHGEPIEPSWEFVPNATKPHPKRVKANRLGRGKFILS